MKYRRIGEMFPCSNKSEDGSTIEYPGTEERLTKEEIRTFYGST